MGNRSVKNGHASSSIRSRGIAMEELREEDEEIEVRFGPVRNKSETGYSIAYRKDNNGTSDHSAQTRYSAHTSSELLSNESNHFVNASFDEKEARIQYRSTGVQSESGLDTTSTMSVSPSSTFAFPDSGTHPSSAGCGTETGPLFIVQNSDDDVNLAQINISGLRAATDTKRKKGRRYLWIFLLSVCFAVMIIQITDRLRHFISEPVSVSVTLARNKSLVFPAITICNKNKFNVTAMRQLFHNNKIRDISDLLQVTNTNSLRLWMLTSHSVRKMVKECWFGRNVTCEQRGHWALSFTTMGVCHTYKLNDSMVHLAGIFHNLYLKVVETETEMYDGDDGWKLYVHDSREEPTLGVQTHGTSLYPGQGRDLRLDMRKVESLHHSRNPCDSTPNYLQNNCFVECFKKRIRGENITCRLPYMNGIDLPWCVHPTNYRRTEKIVNNLFFFGQWSPNECPCRPQCTKLIFTSSLESTTDRYTTGSSQKAARARVYYQDLQFEYIKEEVGYGTIDLLCDIGGTLSLLMGASLLTCCELIEVAWVALMKKCCKQRKKLVARSRHRRKKRRSAKDSSSGGRRRSLNKGPVKVIGAQSV